MRVSSLSRCVVGACCALFVALPAAAQTSTPFFTHGVGCGEPTSTDVVLWTRTASSASLTPELLDDTGAVQRALAPVRTAAETDFTVKTIATGLAPAASIHYRFSGPGGELSPTGTSHTAPPPDPARPLTFASTRSADWTRRPSP